MQYCWKARTNEGAKERNRALSLGSKVGNRTPTSSINVEGLYASIERSYRGRWY